MIEATEMDLQTFISQSLGQIIAGIRAAQLEVAEKRTAAKINPRGATVLSSQPSGRTQAHDLHTKLPVHQVEFDVAVTVARSSEGKAGVGLSVLSIGIGGHKQTSAESSSVSRIRFSVPVVWPDPQTEGNEDNP